ncbi:hypothetical protein RUM43_009016 [Polyplax serrata]|uniref:adenylate cyclase n=1 Tax=Polyplax serrata TaxID=468196 RepID=A0AAN8RU46_POLSC
MNPLLRYHQLRIKILGDCYYCISGAPQERPDHAVLCVHMGLSMVKAIKYVQQTCNSPVDMRVGIHTGAVLAGVLGQTQWQFDVYSKDVELANKMESSGKPGKVHISEKTLSFLNDEFEVEPAYGEKREETLRMAGMKTYFIVKVLKPFKPSKSAVRNGNIHEDSQNYDSDIEAKELDEEFECTSPQEEENQMLNSEKNTNGSEDFKKQLRKELINKGGLSTLSNHTTCFTLSFKSAKKEKDFNHNKETAATVSLLGCPVVLLFISVAQFIILPRDELSILSFTTGFTILVIFSVIAIAELLPSLFFKEIVQCSVTASNILWVRRLLAAVEILVLASVNAVDMVSCDISSSPLNCTAGGDTTTICLYPSYFSYFCVLVLVAASLPTQISHLIKIGIFFVVVALHCAMNFFVVSTALECEENLENDVYLVLKRSTMLVCVALALSFLARHVEKATRVLFQWKTEVEEQREKASDIGRRNEALVYNILPPHVAVHFLGNRKRQHEELYSQSYAEVGVLFASMPNFSDFYSEESVNNQGLECLRFLNEVISDFDAILQLPRFQDIIKIKTIGSTYMAASGLNPSRTVKPDDSVQVRWAHLALLVEFAFELKTALHGINEQSFNHFVLKMGINHGPITAGVIGARKPHYDIWGNSVNVASRMESTGKAGCIQVTEETCKILQHYGYIFEQRGLVTVKGKGQLMTYYLIGKGDVPPSISTESNLVTTKPENSAGECVEIPAISPTVQSREGTTQEFSETNVSKSDETCEVRDNL